MRAQTLLPFLGPSMAMAVPCKKCGGLFDLFYDLENAEDMNDVMSALRTKLTRRQALCWKCRPS